MDSAIKHINVEEIMDEIRREIKEKGYVNDDISLDDIPVSPSVGGIVHSNTLRERILNLRLSYNVAAIRPLKSNRVFGPIIIFVKKVIRKLIKFNIEPVVADQNEHNRMVLCCLQDMFVDIETMKQKIIDLENEKQT